MKPLPTMLLGGTLLLVGCAGASRMRVADSAPQLVITMDDLPVHGPLPEGETRLNVAERILAAFRAAGVPEVYGFVNGANVEGDEGRAVLRAWVAAGYPLGNHTWTHRNLNQATVEEFEDEIVRNEAILQEIGGPGDWHWLRYPNLAEGNDPDKRAGVRAVLAERGYKIAAVTTSFADYEWNDAYQRCRAEGSPQAMTALEDAYLEAVRESIERSRALSQALYGRDVPYVLLSHISAFNARMMPRVLDVYRQMGIEFTTLAQAERHPIYQADLNPSLPAGPTDLAGRARQQGIEVTRGTNRSEMLAAACR